MTHPRLKAALCTTVLAASLATPTLDSALASSPVPALPDVTAALQAAGISSSNAGSVISELTTLQGVAPSGSLGILSLGSLDNALTTLNGGLLGSLLTPVLSLLAALNPAAPSSLTQTLADLQQIAAAPGASTAVVEAVDELTAALTSAGLAQLLSQVSGLTSGQNTSALTALGGLQSLPLGGSVATGSLSSVATVLSTLAGEAGVPAGAASSLTSAAAGLNAGALTPAQLLGVISEVQSAAGGLPAPLNGVASALVAQLSASSSIFGQLASVGNGLPTGSITSALTGLGGLPGLSPGASVPGLSLASVGSILSRLASEPGVPTAAATTLNSIAATLNGPGAVDPSTLLALIGALQGVSGLPAPLGTLVSELTGALGASGSIFGGVPGLSSAQITSALAALGNLPGLAAGSSVAGGVLAPVGGILSQVAAQSAVPAPAAATLNGIAGILASGGALNPAQLQAVIATLQGVTAALPAPLNTVVGNLGKLLLGSGSLTGLGGTGGGTGTGSGSGSGTGSGGTGSGSGTGSGGKGSGGGLGGTGGTATSHSGHATIARVRRKGNLIIVTLECTASANRTCRTTVRATMGGAQESHATITFGGGSTGHVRLHLRATAVAVLSRHRHGATVRVTARTGSYRTSKMLR
ncbi:MAG: hypothetical protein M3071_12975 [Actinomycetota bacterium]|nr:hypothetical protein [Actinomycetota bacterium]